LASPGVSARGYECREEVPKEGRGKSSRREVVEESARVQEKRVIGRAGDERSAAREGRKMDVEELPCGSIA
jgi:hypothetical protein